jgi:hypothetical protein
MTDPKPCVGSGQAPAEVVILDTVPGVEPKGTCRRCGRYLTLMFYRMPEHEEPRRDGN